MSATAPSTAGGAPPSAAEIVRRLELALARRVDGVLHGNHAGRVPGLGSEAGETRRYIPGDDPRRIDWNVTARAQAPHVRDAVAERELESWLVVDLSASTDFGTARCTKRDLVVAAAGALALLASRSGDRVSAHVATPVGLTTLPARTGGAQARALLDALARASRPDPAARPTGRGPDLADALDRAVRHARRRGLVSVLSDFPGTGEWIPAMRAVAARHETLAVEVLDPRELDLPDVGLVVVTDPESGDEREVRTCDARLRRRYAEAARARRAATAAVLRARAVDHLVLRTDRDATADLVGWLAQRPRRLAHLRRQQAVGAGGRWPAMRFLVEWRLFLLVGVGALAGVWVAVARQRRRHVLRFTNVELLDVVAPRDPGWRRHVPPVIFLAALAALIVGFARPVRATRVADERATVVLAVDTSLSMEADDVDPDRLAVARQAAREFVADLPGELNVGLVTFHGATAVAAAPSRDRAALIAAIDAMQLGEGTAIGEAIFSSLDAIAAAPRGEDDGPAPAHIVVMSDGETTVGRANEDAARAAADAGVAVDTIAFGTSDGVIEDDFGVTTPVPVAPEPLADIAATTGGMAFAAESLGELSAVYADLGRVVGYEEVDEDVSGWFVGAGIALLAVAASLSLLWFQRLP